MWVARQGSKRHGRWEAIKNDLEIAGLLGADDPHAKWLTEYAKIRLSAYAADEAEGARRKLPIVLGTPFVGAAAIWFLGGCWLTWGAISNGRWGDGGWGLLLAVVGLMTVGIVVSVVVGLSERTYPVKSPEHRVAIDELSKRIPGP